MQDAFSYCGELVRQADRDRFLAALFAPAHERDALFALYAFNVEIARVREVAREALAGEIRLQWWSEVLAGERGEEASANPVAAALLATIERHRLATTALSDLIEARRFDLYDEPMATIAELEAYTSKTSSVLIALAAQILDADAMTDALAAAEPAGIAYGITGLLRAFPVHTARRQLYAPTEILMRHKVSMHELFAGKSSSALDAALREMRSLARRYLAAAHERVLALPAQALPAFLAVSLVWPSLDLLERSNPFAPKEISAWRRQWLIWRAARNPARIAG
jgi:phytoene synthase